MRFIQFMVYEVVAELRQGEVGGEGGGEGGGLWG